MPQEGDRLGSSDAGSDPTNTTTRKAYDLMAEGYGPGTNGPFQVVVLAILGVILGFSELLIDESAEHIKVGLEALKEQTSPRSVAQRRGKKVADLLGRGGASAAEAEAQAEAIAE